MERRKVTREFKVEAVKLIQGREVTVAQASRDFGGAGLSRPEQASQKSLVVSGNRNVVPDLQLA
jgi:transposase-like protein